MTCDDLAYTGSVLPWTVFGIALLLLLTGIVFVLRRRRGGSGVATVLLLGSLTAVLVIAPTPSAHAACPAPANSLTIVQTSVNSGLSPTQPPSTITGLVINNGPDDTYITTVTVSITSVTKSPTAVPGVCDASDYVILNPQMPVNAPLGAYGGSTGFAGAQIGFFNKPTNQDQCQGATVELLFVAL
jgi:hypothetical protein